VQGATSSTVRSNHVGWWVAGGCASIGCGTLALIGTVVVGLLFWWASLWWLPSEPWVEASYPSPDGRYIVYNEGRGIGLKLEARLTISTPGEFEERDSLLPWSRSLPRGVEWIDEHEFVIHLRERPRSGDHGLIQRMWRDLRFTIDRE
jgi:hypothetical protein